MAENLSVRQLGSVGIITDINPYDLPPPAISAGVNIRFDNGRISRGPVARTVYEFTGSEATHSPGHILAIPPITSGSEELVTVQSDFAEIYSLNGSTLTDVTYASPAAGVATDPISSCFLGNVSYLNHRSRVPVCKRQSDATYIDLPNWDATWRCGTFRAYKDYLIAINVTKGATAYPTMVKWSDVAMFGDVPASWDETSTTTLAGENILNDMRGSLLDGLALRDSFMLYSDGEVWAMDHIGGTFIFRFSKRFNDVGVLAANCVVEVDGKHYVFDRNDLYAHDGVSKQSLAHSTVKDFVFSGLVKELEHLSFVTHNARLNEVLFCYPSNDRFTRALPLTGCNRAAAFNYRNGTWSFYDLPNVTSATEATLETSLTWASTSPDVWNSLGGTWLGSDDSEDHHLLFVGPNTEYLGDEMVTNGTGTSTAGWTGVNGTVSLDAGALKFTSTAAGDQYMYQGFPTEIGKEYEVSFTNVATSGFNPHAYIGTAPYAYDYFNLPHFAGTTNTNRFVATTTTTYISLFGGGPLGWWSSFDDITAKKVLNDEGLTASRIYGFDLIADSRLSRPIEEEALRDGYAERIGIDLDDNGTPLRLYKCILEAYPQMAHDADDAEVSFSFGANDQVGADPVWADYQTFDPTTMSKLDYRSAGRYLAWRIKAEGRGDFGLSGMDTTVSVRGRRG